MRDHCRKKTASRFHRLRKDDASRESQIGPIEGHWRMHSESGWQTWQTFQADLTGLREVMGEGSIHLLLDSYSADKTAAVRETVAHLDIKLYFIPPGLTVESLQDSSGSPRYRSLLSLGATESLTCQYLSVFCVGFSF
jgi:hypothetical protein